MQSSESEVSAIYILCTYSYINNITVISVTCATISMLKLRKIEREKLKMDRFLTTIVQGSRAHAA